MSLSSTNYVDKLASFCRAPWMLFSQYVLRALYGVCLRCWNAAPIKNFKLTTGLSFYLRVNFIHPTSSTQFFMRVFCAFCTSLCFTACLGLLTSWLLAIFHNHKTLSQIYTCLIVSCSSAISIEIMRTLCAVVYHWFKVVEYINNISTHTQTCNKKKGVFRIPLLPPLARMRKIYLETSTSVLEESCCFEEREHKIVHACEGQARRAHLLLSCQMMPCEGEVEK